MHVGGIFNDLAKAFDCRHHEILLGDLHFCGIGGVFTCSYVTHRGQKVQLKSSNAAQNFL